jgi:hypothetical protein
MNSVQSQSSLVAHAIGSGEVRLKEVVDAQAEPSQTGKTVTSGQTMNRMRMLWRLTKSAPKGACVSARRKAEGTQPAVANSKAATWSTSMLALSSMLVRCPYYQDSRRTHCHLSLRPHPILPLRTYQMILTGILVLIRYAASCSASTLPA